MRMFLGQYSPNITEGSRIALPKKLRDQIRGDKLILSRGFERCIFAYAKEDWMAETRKHLENPMSEKGTRDIKRYMFAPAAEVVIDAQGRFVVPMSLKEYAGISSRTCVIGAGDHIEIWDVDMWEGHLEKISKELSA